MEAIQAREEERREDYLQRQSNRQDGCQGSQDGGCGLTNTMTGARTECKSAGGAEWQGRRLTRGESINPVTAGGGWTARCKARPQHVANKTRSGPARRTVEAARTSCADETDRWLRTVTWSAGVALINHRSIFMSVQNRLSVRGSRPLTDTVQDSVITRRLERTRDRSRVTSNRSVRPGDPRALARALTAPTLSSLSRILPAPSHFLRKISIFIFFKEPCYLYKCIRTKSKHDIHVA